jgi:hypothetical protein
MIKLFLTASLVLLSACTTDRFRSNVKPQEMQELSQQAVSSEHLNVAGIDIWSKGVPDKKYIILGVIHDKRRNATFKLDTYNQDIAKLVKKSNGDAAVILIAESKKVDYIAQGGGSSLGNAQQDGEGGGASLDPYAPGMSNTIYSENRESTDAPLEYRESHVLVVKYVK